MASKSFSKANTVIETPLRSLLYTPLINITNAVIEQTIIEKINLDLKEATEETTWPKDRLRLCCVADGQRRMQERPIAAAAPPRDGDVICTAGGGSNAAGEQCAEATAQS